METNELPKKRFPQSDKPRGETRKRLYFSPKEGTYTIRLLAPSFKRKYSHFLNSPNGFAKVQCLTDMCPVCLENDRIRSQYPEDYRDVPGYSPQTITCSTNIIDLTDVKACECGIEHYVGVSGNFPSDCYSCKRSLLDTPIAPSNKVKIFSRGKTIFDQLSDIHTVSKEQTGMDISQYNLTVIARKRSDGGKGSTLAVMASTHMNQPLEGEYVGYDLDNEPLKLSAEEIVEFRGGVSIRDLFAARSNNRNTTHTKPESTPPVAEVAQTVAAESSQAVQDIVDNYFN